MQEVTGYGRPEDGPRFRTSPQEMQRMNKFIIVTGLALTVALPAAGQSATSNGQVVPTTTAARVKINVSASLASTVRISADSAFALARANAANGEVSSAELESKAGRLLYEVQVLNRNKGATTVKIDAVSGEVLEAEKHGGLKAPAIHHKENKKLLDAKRDSAAKNP
jgi:uncharacterized membrane protein YkoI